MARRNATHAAQMPSTIESQSGNDQKSATSSRPGRRIAPSPVANFSAIRPSRAANDDGSTRPTRLSVCAEPGRIPGENEQDDERDERAGRGRAAGPLHGGERDRIRRVEIAAEHEDVRRQQHEDRQHVEQPLEDDRRERAGRAHAFVPREKIWANDLAGRARQDAARRKPDGRRAKRVARSASGRAARAGTATATRG